MAFKDELQAHLGQFPTAPFLFMGAGMSRRYMGLDDWAGLLRRYAEVAGQSYEYYTSSADGHLPQTASLIANDLHEKWWKEDEFEESRDEFASKATGKHSALKFEIAKELGKSLEALPDNGPLADELALLAAALGAGLLEAVDQLGELLGRGPKAERLSGAAVEPLGDLLEALFGSPRRGSCPSGSTGEGGRSCSRWSPAARGFGGRRSRPAGRPRPRSAGALPSPSPGPR